MTTKPVFSAAFMARQQAPLKTSLYALLPRKVGLTLRWNANRLLRQSSYTESQYLRLRRCNGDSYSLRPFDQTQSIFVHIPKCAGISVNKALYGNLAGGHKTFNQYLTTFEPKLVLNYFKFTIVRNPWDRLVSAYHFLQKGGANSTDLQWANRHLAAYTSFEQFVHYWLTPDNARSWYHFRPQSDFIIDSSAQISLDYIGYFETLEQDFAYIASRLNKDVQLAKTNKSQHVDYRSYYNDETRAIVADVYAKDISLLGYNFDNSQIVRASAAPITGGTAHV